MALNAKERELLVEMAVVAKGRGSLAAVARRVGLSYRQVKRVWRRYREEGAKGLAHRSRGRRSNRRVGEEVRERCLAECRGRLERFGPTLAAEKLAELGIAKVDHETLRRWMVAEGLWSRHRKRKPHRQWRERKAHFGELVQLDGSFFDWFGSGDQPCLMNMVDDATGETLGRIFRQETTEAAMHVLWAWIERYGVPRALYTDWKTVYLTKREPTVEEQLAGDVPRTVFGRACERLGIAIIGASSPQAKGRVERSNGTYQDRLAKELRLRGISTVEEANQLLAERFCPHLNAKFAIQPRNDEDWHRSAPPSAELERVFVDEETRVVQNDWCVRHENRYFQLTGPKERLPRPKAKVVMQRRLTGSLHILYHDHELEFREIPLEARAVPAQGQSHAALEPQVSPSDKPRADHPWRRAYSFRVLAAQAAARRGAAAPSTQP